MVSRRSEGEKKRNIGGKYSIKKNILISRSKRCSQLDVVLTNLSLRTANRMR